MPITAPNQANTQWLFVDGTLRLQSNPQLCMTGIDAAHHGLFVSAPVTVESCQTGNPAQQFQFSNMTSFYPYAFLSQGAYVFGPVAQVSATRHWTAFVMIWYKPHCVLTEQRSWHATDAVQVPWSLDPTVRQRRISAYYVSFQPTL